MDFIRFIEQNNQEVTTFILSLNDEEVSRNVDLEAFKDAINDYVSEIISYGLGIESSFVINRTDFSKKRKDDFETNYVIKTEGNSFDLFYELVGALHRKEKNKAYQLYDRIKILAFNGDFDAQAAEAMCQMEGIFCKKNEAKAFDKLEFLGVYCDNLCAITLTGQYNYFVVYQKLGNEIGLIKCKECLDYAISKGSNMAISFYEKYKNNLK
jgi:hypothetical protein